MDRESTLLDSVQILQGSLKKHEINSAMIKPRFPQLSSENDMKCDGVCVFHIHSLQTTYMFTLHDVLYH